MGPKIKIQRLGETPGFALPRYMSSGSSGMDLSACLEGDLVLLPGERALVPCGFSLELPVGWEAQVRPRSGLALRHGITCLNSPGTIDADYRGEIKVILANLGTEPFIIQSGMRMAQMVFQKIEQVELELVSELEESFRGAGGFGSTGHV